MPIKILLLCLTLAITSCSFFQVHKVEIEQGNRMTPSMVNQLKKGMSEEAVLSIMGTPVLVNVINGHDRTYLYTLRIGEKRIKEEKVILYFNRGRLATVEMQGV